MLNIKRFTVNPLGENCYVASDETRECVVIDCGALYEAETKAIVDYIRQEQLTPQHQVYTHGHFDHLFGCEAIYQTFGLALEIHRADEVLLEDIAQQTLQVLGCEVALQVPPIGRYLSQGDTIDFGTHRLSVIHTPGHSPGSVMLYCKSEGLLFSGDTLFRMSVGRTDLTGGSYEQLTESLNRIASTLPGETKVLPGHGPETTIADERKYNPYMRFM